jgi:zinc/manganese transport system permease protein
VFAGFMVNAWTVGTIVAVVAGLVGFFVVLRGSAFAAHAIPNGSFAGAAGAALIGINTLIGLGVFSLLGALGIGILGRRGRHDAVTALTLVLMLALGSLFLSLSTQYAPEVYSLLFGEVLGISPNQVAPTAVLAALCVIAIAVLYRPLLLSSIVSDIGEARGINSTRMQLMFLALVALTTTMTVPVVGTLLIFSLMLGAPAAARSFTDRAGRAMCLSVAFALLTIWAAIALSYHTNYPIGFFVGTISALTYTAGRIWSATRQRGTERSNRPLESTRDDHH